MMIKLISKNQQKALSSHLKPPEPVFTLRYTHALTCGYKHRGNNGGSQQHQESMFRGHGYHWNSGTSHRITRSLQSRAVALWHLESQKNINYKQNYKCCLKGSKSSSFWGEKNHFLQESSAEVEYFLTWNPGSKCTPERWYAHIFWLELFTSYFLTVLKAVNPTPVSTRNCKILFMFRSITLKQLNSLTAINTLSCLGGL